MQPDVLVSVRNLARVYGRGLSAVTALDVSGLAVGRGDFVALTGPSGCGKTTFLNLLGALDRPSRGEILFEGKNIAGLGETDLCRFRRARVGYIFQDYNLIPALSALQNVLVPSYPLRNGRQTRDRAHRLLDRVGLAGKGGRRPGELSGGEQQRVALARALLLDPDLILADEPTGNLDSATGAGIIELLMSLNAGGKTVLVATHDRRVAEICRRNIEMVDGSVVRDHA